VVSAEQEQIMTARETILAAVRRNLPQPAVPLPEVRRFPRNGRPILAEFQRQLEEMGGRSFKVDGLSAARAKVAELFPAARVVCSATPEVPGTGRVQDVKDPHDLNNVDVGIVRSPLGVAESGAVWLTQKQLFVNALGVLSQHLIVLLDPAAVVETMADAYRQIDLAASPYGVFMAGPSATGDIEGVIIHGAQGARSLTVLLLAQAGS
jgi:L-lactate dehydrogenase complex protein LldG